MATLVDMTRAFCCRVARFQDITAGHPDEVGMSDSPPRHLSRRKFLSSGGKATLGAAVAASSLALPNNLQASEERPQPPLSRHQAPQAIEVFRERQITLHGRTGGRTPEGARCL
jgi:hypothetical protein